MILSLSLSFSSINATNRRLDSRCNGKSKIDFAGAKFDRENQSNPGTSDFYNNWSVLVGYSYTNVGLLFFTLLKR